MTKREKELREDLITKIIGEIEEAKDSIRLLQGERNSLQDRIDEMFEEIKAMENIVKSIDNETEEGL